ncbi:MAG: hypothetical protein AB7I48_12400 [Planctomycetaceae bacterium]
MTRRLPILLPLVILAMAGTLIACSVPVFRYAFEHWRPDPYLAMVFHRGGLTEPEQALIARLQPPQSNGAGIANLDVRTVDLDDEADETLAAIWAEQQTDALPWMVVKAPPKQGPPATIFAGALSEDHASQLIESPVRRDLQKRLLSGDSVVWLFLGSGNPPADDAAFAVLQVEIERLEQVIELPEIEEADRGELSLDPAALKLRMSALRISRDDPAERMLVEMLLHVEPDLRDEAFVSQPMAFPVFGRGRALYALVGNGITADTIEEACRFLTAGCQCTVKAQNPGVDLLMSVDWDQFIQPSPPADTAPPALTGLAEFAVAAESAESESTARVIPEVENGAGDSRLESTQGADAPTLVSGTSQTVGSSPADPESSDHDAEAAPSKSPLPVTPSLTGRLVLVIGVLAMGVVVASMVLIPRSR